MQWQRRGPRPTTQGQVENIADREVVGAIQAIAAHPIDPDVVDVAAVNGGIWRTRNAMATAPAWLPLTDLEQTSRDLVPRDPTGQERTP